MGLPAVQPRFTLFVGLTDQPEARRRERGKPGDWQVYGPFHSEAAARRWQRMMSGLPGSCGAGAERGWRYGFTHSVPVGRPRPTVLV